MSIKKKLALKRDALKAEKSTPPVALPTQPERDYETENHMRTLEDAEMLKQDPEKMHKVMKHAQKKLKAIQSVADLRELYKNKYEGKEQA